MNSRDWFCIALRIFAIWMLIQSVETIVPYLAFALSGKLQGSDIYQLILMFLAPVVRTMIGLVLLFFASAIATRFYPISNSTETIPFSGEAKPLKIGIQLLAVYALLLAVQSVAGVIAGYLSGGYLGSLVTCGLNMAFAAILLIWNENIITFIEKFRYVAERDAYQPPPLNE